MLLFGGVSWPFGIAEDKLIGRKIPGFFPTPKAIISRMLELAEIQPGERALEPSAGNGDILDMLRDHHHDAEVTAIEINGDLMDVLQAMGHEAEHGDFLHHQAPYEGAVMNPPFENAQDLDYVRHAHRLLVAGGRLVSVMSAGPFFRADKKGAEFREWLQKHEHDLEDLPEDAFKGVEAFRQTGVKTKLVLIRKDHQ